MFPPLLDMCECMPLMNFRQSTLCAVVVVVVISLQGTTSSSTCLDLGACPAEANLAQHVL